MLDTGAASRGSGNANKNKEKAVRQWFVEQDLIEGVIYLPIRTSICIFLGVSPPMLFAIMTIDVTWGGFVHVGENFMKNARFGFLEKFVLTPSHHRVHHARNPVYLDTNFCNLLNLWDHVQDLSARTTGCTARIRDHAYRQSRKLPRCVFW